MQRVLFAWLLLTVGLHVSGCATRGMANLAPKLGALRLGPSLDILGRNTDADDPYVTRHDFVLARDQTWWGRPVTVGQGQIVERWSEGTTR